MKKKKSRSKPVEFPALIALRRAAKKALEIARQTGTPAYVLQDGKIVDIARRTRRKRKS